MNDRFDNSIDRDEVFFRSRIIRLMDYIEDSEDFITKLNILSVQDSKKPITIYIQSPGGYVDAGLTMYDAMMSIPNHICTIGMGEVSSMASILLMAGHPGIRYIMPHCWVMLHQSQIDVEGDTDTLVSRVNFYKRQEDQFTKIIAKHTGQTIKTIEKETSKEKWFSADEAVKWGIVDMIVTPEMGMPSTVIKSQIKPVKRRKK